MSIGSYLRLRAKSAPKSSKEQKMRVCLGIAFGAFFVVNLAWRFRFCLELFSYP
ncbi:unnamed protein product [Acidithrix sp. C25]|nr:unnamed protein product [Acidithrix sp. C25]